MAKTVDIVFEILLNEIFKKNHVSSGDISIPISVSDIFNICDKKRSKRSIERSLKDLNDLGFIKYDSQEKKKIKEIIVKNILLVSKNTTSGLIFDSTKEFIKNIIKIKNSYVLKFPNLDNEKDSKFVECLDLMFKLLNKLDNGENFSKSIFSNYSFLIFGFNENNGKQENFKTNKFIPFTVSDVAVSSQNVADDPQNVADALNRVENSNCDKNDPNCDISGVNCDKTGIICDIGGNMYVHKEIYSCTVQNYEYYNSTYINDRMSQFGSEMSQMTSKMSQIEEKTTFEGRREGKMDNEGFIGKMIVKKNPYPKKPISKNLFESEVKPVNYEDIVIKSEMNRNFENTPLPAYKAKQWIDLINNRHRIVRGCGYSSTVQMDLQALTGKIYPIVFDRFQFSALDFKEFLFELIDQKSSSGEFVKFVLGFIGSNGNRMTEIETFISKRKKLREEDLFEGKIFIPHWPLTSDSDDLYTVIDRLPKNNLALIYNYGLTVFHRYLQVKHSLPFDEATYFISDVFIKEFYETDLVKTRPEVVERIVYGIAKNSTLWEPYPVNELGKNKYLDSLDWRKKYNRIFLDSNLKLNQEPWWRQLQDRTLNPISSVELMFRRKNKNALHLEEISL